MFTQIQTEMDLLVVEIEKILDQIATLRANENNSNIYIEYGGRLIGLTEAISKIRQTQLKINQHIADILRNTTDGNYLMKLDLLEDENSVLQDKIAILKEELEKYTKFKRTNKTNIPISADCLKELSEDEIDTIIEDAYCNDISYEGDDEEE